MFRKRIVALLLAIVCALTLASCLSGKNQNPTSKETTDREGNPITLPARIERVIVLGPSNAEIISALGLTDLIVATDSYSANVEGIDPETAVFSMWAPDAELMLSMEPDLIIITGMSKVGGDDPLKSLSEAGVCVAYVPSSDSIEGIKEDIRFIAEILGAEDGGEQIIEEMEAAIAEISEAAAGAKQKTVYFEIAAAPEMYSFGSGVFLNEMIEIIGAVNILGDQEGWLSVSDEAVLDLNPDVILTNVSYIPDAVDEIMSRPGWDAITAIQNGEVYYIDNDASSRPSQHIIKALLEMAAAIYPEIFGQ